MNSLKNIAVGISISEPDVTELAQLGLGIVHLQDTMVETARYLLSKGYNLAYGGDLSYSAGYNFTELLFQLGMTYGGIKGRISNYAAFPLYTKISKRREAELLNVAKIIRVNPSAEFDKWLSVRYDETGGEERKYLDWVFDGKEEESKKIWADSLTEMRRQMTANIQCRIVMGGKTQNYKGSMPGILEEAILSVEANKSLIVDLKFGGAAVRVKEALDSYNSIKTKTLGHVILLKQGELDAPEIENILSIL